jgi:beta-lysine 5,6-aminomutase beta subunit
MNMKGYSGDYGLERYTMMEAYNLGSQVPNEELLRKAAEVNADAVLVSQVVTQKNVHIQNLTELIEMAEAENLRDKLIMIVGGPRIDQALAAELGFDAGFGPGTTARHVSTFIVKELARRL